MVNWCKSISNKTTTCDKTPFPDQGLGHTLSSFHHFSALLYICPLKDYIANFWMSDNILKSEGINVHMHDVLWTCLQLDCSQRESMVLYISKCGWMVVICQNLWKWSKKLQIIFFKIRHTFSGILQYWYMPYKVLDVVLKLAAIYMGLTPCHKDQAMVNPKAWL